MARERIAGIDWLRAFACLSVVWVHSLSRALVTYDLPEASVELAKMLQITFIFATPMFVMMSEYILSYSYPDRVPDGFWKKRISYILIPYFTIPFIYAGYFGFIGTFTWEAIFDRAFNFILYASWHGYFILIIFQFYVLHFIFNRIHKYLNPYLMISLSILITMGYNLFFKNFSSPGGNWDLIWNHYGIILFPGWLAFFTVAYFAGRYAGDIKPFLKKAGPGFIILTIIALLYCIDNVMDGLTSISSRRNDVLIYTILLFMTVLSISVYIKKVPYLIKVISKYSFAIYLLHLLLLQVYAKYLPYELSVIAFTFSVFVFGVVASIAISWVLKWIPGSQFLIGQLKK
ncbi:acyltransferase family protein [Jeotgalibacillus terrae]|uniref:Acyltransferase family protein n=1 Tax=Jeotgalibacillus terrae TaxID=587735 RepID=A0ABW5ZC95_9BACL|nr:acyltransferase family protein [Jeotgalibacillus terrae]MBM7577791.1 membrane-bound acyltransferase YfiQ involved in biofilm formation [Jeotgalibacillus terrae]